MRNYSIIYIFILLNVFLFIISSFDTFNGFNGPTHANDLNKFLNIGSHEYENYGVLNILLSNISYFNIFFSIFFFLTISSLGFYCLKKSFFNFILNKVEGYEKNIILYIGSFSLGSIIFVGIYRFISLNLPIQILNTLILFYIIFFIFIYLYKIKINLLIFIKNKYSSLLVILLLLLILISQIDMAQHHIIGDAFYNYGNAQIIRPFILNSEYIPLIGTHYFEEIFIFPIIYFLNDFFYTSNIDYTTFQVAWVFQAFAKLSSICLIYICFRFFENSKIKCLVYTIFIFAANLSGNYFFNPLLYGAGNPFLLSINAYRPSGLIIFIFVSTCYFLKPITKNSLHDYLICIFFLIGISSLGLQYPFLFILFFLFIYAKEIGSLKIIKEFKNFFFNKFKINIFLCILLILVTYLIIGQNLKTHEFAPYILIIPLFLSFFNFYSLNVSENVFKLNNFFKLTLFLFLIIIVLIFFGNIFTYKFLFPTSPSNIDFIKLINKSILSTFSHANQILDEGKYIYRALIHFEEKNIYQLKNICTQRGYLKMPITGMTSFHCIGGLKNLTFGLGFIFLILVFNTFIIKDIYSKNNKDNKDKYFLFLYSLSLFFFIFSLFFNDMIDGRYMVHARTRFLEISYALIIFVFLITISSYISQKIHYRLVFSILIIKIISPFYVNFFDNNSWYFNQFVENIKYILLIN